MSTPLFNIGGIASGLDTQAILSQLLRLERQPILRFEERQAKLRRVDEAWAQMNTRLSAVREALDQVRRSDRLAAHVEASSSQPDAVNASASAGAQAGSLSFTVASLATSHRVAAAGTFAGPDTLVGEGAVTITLDGGGEHTLETDGSTTLAQLAEGIRGLGAGLSAQVVATVPGEYRLIVSANSTGTGGAFEISGDLDGLESGEVLQQGADAHLRIGSLDVYRSTNTVTDLFEGVTLELARTTSDPVTVTVERDVDGALASVKALVDALNAALDRARSLSSYNAETREAGPLQGDATLRGLVTQLRAAASGAVAGLEPGANHGSAIGLGLGRDGRIQLDETRLRQALSDDFDAVVALVARTGRTTDPRVAYASAGADVAPGTYQVGITRAAAVAAVTGTGYSPPVGQPKTFTITTSGGQVVSVQIDTEDTTAQSAVTKVQAALQQAGVTSVRVRLTGDEVTFEHGSYGSAHGFTITGGDVFGIADGAYDGADVEGSVDGQPATGRGRLLTGAEGAAAGLALTISATQAQVDAAGGTLDLGTVTFSHGIGGALHDVLRAYEGSGGLIAGARQSLSTQIRRFDQSIADFEVRVAAREVTLRRQFTALESAMGQLQAQSAWMASQIMAMA